VARWPEVVSQGQDCCWVLCLVIVVVPWAWQVGGGMLVHRRRHQPGSHHHPGGPRPGRPAPGCFTGWPGSSLMFAPFIHHRHRRGPGSSSPQTGLLAADHVGLTPERWKSQAS